MKYVIVINQKELMKIAPSINESEAIILDYLVFYCSSLNKKIAEKRVEGFTWINYQTIISDLPILSCKTPASIVGKIKNIESYGFITTKRIATNSGEKKYVKLNEMCDLLFAERVVPFSKVNGAVQESKSRHLEKQMNNNTNDKSTKDTKEVPLSPKGDAPSLPKDKTLVRLYCEAYELHFKFKPFLNANGKIAMPMKEIMALERLKRSISEEKVREILTPDTEGRIPVFNDDRIMQDKWVQKRLYFPSVLIDRITEINHATAMEVNNGSSR